jgi:serine/threonine protein phosphatase PrpC
LPKPLVFQHAAAWASGQDDVVGHFETGRNLLLSVTSPLCRPSLLARAARLTRDRIDWTCREMPQDNPRRFLTKVFGDANSALFAAGNQEGEPGAMALSMAAFWTDGLDVAYGHVGNARLYLLRDGLIRAVTQDHTQAQQMVDQALLKPEEAKNHPFSREVLRGLGRKPMIDAPVLGPLPAKNGDYYILCSAGLVRRLSDADIGNTIVEGELLDACHRLISMAVSATGGEDDLVAIQAVRFGDPSGGRRVEAYNPIDNITRSLMKSEATEEPILRDKKILGRLIAAALLGAYLLVFLIADPDCSSRPEDPANETEAAGTAEDPGDAADAPTDEGEP